MPDHPPPGWVPPAPPPGGPAPEAAGSGYGPPPPGAGYGYGYAAPPWFVPVHKPGVVALRPLRLGDLFDGAFKTIRRNPKAMVGLSAVVVTCSLVVPVVLTLVLAATGNLSLDLFSTPTTRDQQLTSLLQTGTTTAAGYVGALFAALATVLLNGLLVRVVAEAVLGRSTTIGEAWAATRGRLPRLLGLALLTGLTGLVLFGVPIAVGVLVGFRVGIGAGVGVGLPLLLLGFVLFVFVQVRYFLLAAPALVLERIGIGAALRRAGALSRGQFWRLLGISLLTGLVVGLVSEVISVPLSLLGLAGSAAFSGAGSALAVIYSGYLSQIIVGAVTTPFTSGVVALQYVDQRIRKEGLDVQLIAASQQPPGTRG